MTLQTQWQKTLQTQWQTQTHSIEAPMLPLVNLLSAAAKLVGLVKGDRDDDAPAPLDGKKTYICAVALVLYGLCGAYCGFHTPTEAVALVLNGLGLGSIRHALERMFPRLAEELFKDVQVVDPPRLDSLD